MNKQKKANKEEKMSDFRTKLTFKLHDITVTKEELVTPEIMKAFLNEKISPQQSVLSYRIDICFNGYKLQ